jgi:hypothetical protein
MSDCCYFFYASFYDEQLKNLNISKADICPWKSIARKHLIKKNKDENVPICYTLDFQFYYYL